MLIGVNAFYEVAASENLLSFRRIQMIKTERRMLANSHISANQERPLPAAHRLTNQPMLFVHPGNRFFHCWAMIAKSTSIALELS